MLAALEVFRVSKQIVYQKFDDHQRQISKIFCELSEIGGCALRTLPVLYFLADADVAQLVEHDLAKVGVAGSNPVVRSIVANRPVIIKSFDRPFHDGVDEMATWPSGKAEACKAFTPGSNPASPPFAPLAGRTV